MRRVKWLRARFKSSADDFRPIYDNDKNPEGPWWCTGYEDDFLSDERMKAIIVAYVKSEETLLKQWPEAEDVEYEERDDVTFTDRFPKPEWWVE